MVGIYTSFTALFISLKTGKKCVRFVELAHVIVAIFDKGCGRPVFVSKKELKKFAYCYDISDAIAMQKEWAINFNSDSKQVDVISTQQVTKQEVLHQLKNKNLRFTEQKINKGSRLVALPKEGEDEAFVELGFEVIPDSGRIFAFFNHSDLKVSAKEIGYL